MHASQLERLDLGGNSLEFISSDAFKNLARLQELLLDNNALHWLSSGAFKDLASLQYFKAARNRFSNLHDIQILHLNRVEIIDLQSNNIKYRA